MLAFRRISEAFGWCIETSPKRDIACEHAVPRAFVERSFGVEVFASATPGDDMQLAVRSLAKNVARVTIRAKASWVYYERQC